MAKDTAKLSPAQMLLASNLFRVLVAALLIAALNCLFLFVENLPPFVGNFSILLFIIYLSAIWGLKGGITSAIILLIHIIIYSWFLNILPLRLPILGVLIRFAAYGAIGVGIGYLFEIRIRHIAIIKDVLQSSRQSATAAVKVFANTIAARDDYTGTHCERVAHNAYALSKSFFSSRNKQQEIYWAGLLHDVGKISIDDTVLRKQGKLSDEEFEHIKTHAQQGYDILLEPFTNFPTLLDGVKHHHERWDGKGYPDGLKGEKIPVVARIMAIVDVFEALTTVRPYKKAYSAEEAIAMLRRERGTHFDPVIVDEFAKLLQQGIITVNNAVYHYTHPTMLPLGMMYSFHSGLKTFKTLEDHWYSRLLDDMYDHK